MMGFLILLGFIFTVWACWNLANHIKAKMTADPKPAAPDLKHIKRVLGPKDYEDMVQWAKRVESHYDKPTRGHHGR